MRATASGLSVVWHLLAPVRRDNTPARTISIIFVCRNVVMVAAVVTAAGGRLADCLFDGKPAPDFDEESGLAYIRL